MSECCNGLQARVVQLEAEVTELWVTIRKIHEENKKTIEAMTNTIKAAEGFRDRVFAALEKQTGKTIN